MLVLAGKLAPKSRFIFMKFNLTQVSFEHIFPPVKNLCLMLETDLKLSVLAAYKRLLRPLVRILLRNNVSFSEFSEIAKNVYVEVAASDFELAKADMPEGRIAILTGLTRKEVDRLVHERGRQESEYESNLNRIARILSGWHTDPQFTGPYGLPLDLPFDADSSMSFCELARRYTNDIPAQAMLDELLRIGVVKDVENSRFRVLTRTYLPQVDAPESMDLLGNAVSNFVETLDFNRVEENADTRLFERTVIADEGLRVSDLAEFQAYLRDRGQFLLEEIDDWLSKREPISPDEKESVVDTGVGIYHYIRKNKD